MPRHAKLGSLKGAFGWIITDGKRGMEAQCEGVADALGIRFQHKRVSPTGIHRLLSPWLMPGASAWRDGTLAPPWPDIAIATGRLSIPYIRALARIDAPDIFRVVLQDPKTGTGTADVIWVPEHDRLRGTSVITTLTAPHSLSPDRLAALREAPCPEITDLPVPRAALLLGGDGGGYQYSPDDEQRLAAAIASLATLGVSLLITPSRRTSPTLMRAVDQATHRFPRMLWQGEGNNPYPKFLAHAGLLVVTADSVNMTGEACATGRPVFVFHPSKGSTKFKHFHHVLEQRGITRSLPDKCTTLLSWAYEPLFSPPSIAAAITAQWQAWRKR